MKSVPNNQGIVSDNIHADVLAVGKKSHAEKTIHGADLNGSTDLKSLAKELSQLRAQLKIEATTPEQDIVVGSVAQAEQSASQNDGPQTFDFLAKAGKWALEVATKIGTSMAEDAIKKSIGLK